MTESALKWFQLYKEMTSGQQKRSSAFSIEAILGLKGDSCGQCEHTAPDSTAKEHVTKRKRATEHEGHALRAKRVRTIFTPEQLEKLEREFERQQYMVGPERLYLASNLQLSEAQVKVWFQNRRIKWRKQHLEHQMKQTMT